MTIRYVVLLILSLSVTFVVALIQLDHDLLCRIDGWIVEEARDFAKDVASMTISQAAQECRDEVAFEAGPLSVCFALTDARGRVLASSDLSAWRALDIPWIGNSKLKDKDEVIVTTVLPGQSTSARVVAKRLPDGRMVIVGRSRKRDDETMRLFGRIFFVAFIVTVVIGAFLGWHVAKQAMAGVERVTNAAALFGGASLDVRVSPGTEGAEIARLVEVFNEMLDRISALVNEMESVTDNVAHDLRSPLMRIRATAEMALRGPQDIGSYRDAIGTAVEECDRLVEMVNVMLEIAKTEAGMLILEHKHIDLSGIVAESVDLYQPVADECGVDVNLSIPDGSFIVSGDERKLQRLAANLLDNAVKYTPCGGRIELKLSNEAEMVVLYVSDTGAGIPEELRERVFERFFRSDSSRSTPGHGLGLSLARTIARSHGGDVVLQPGPDGGSVFVTRLPRVDAA